MYIILYANFIQYNNIFCVIKPVLEYEIMYILVVNESITAMTHRNIMSNMSKDTKLKITAK